MDWNTVLCENAIRCLGGVEANNSRFVGDVVDGASCWPGRGGD